MLQTTLRGRILNFLLADIVYILVPHVRQDGRERGKELPAVEDS